MMKFVKYDIKKIEILLMLLFVAFQSRAYDFEKDGIYYNFNGTIPFEVFVTYRDNPFDVGYQPSYSGVVVIPETVEFANKYYRITEIGDFAFRGCSSLSSIEIPGSCTTIGSGAFGGCEGLTEIILPESLSYIGSSAFSGCTSLMTVNIPIGIKYIGGSAFGGTPWYNNQPNGEIYFNTIFYAYKGKMPPQTHIDIRDGTTQISDGAFRYCSELASVTIPGSVDKIGVYAFKDCVGLTSVEIGYGVKIIENEAFDRCINLTSISLPESLTTIGRGVFMRCESLVSLSIPKSVKNIGFRAFDGTPWYNNQPDGVMYINDILYTYKGEMPSDTHIDIRKGTVAISSDAFARSSNRMTSLTIPKSVTSIGEWAFAHCYDLKSVTIPGSVVEIGANAFYSGGLTSITIEDGVTIIGSEAFMYCKLLTSMDIPTSVKKIGTNAFLFTPWYSAQPDGLIYINDILCDYKGLAPYDTHLKVRDGTVSISTATFLDLENIVSVMLPGSVSSIGQEAFSGCTGLTEITCKAAVPPICEADCFLGIGQRDCKLYVAEGSVEAYRNAPVWQNFDIIATDFSGIEEISAEGSVRIYASGGSIVLENLSPGMPVAVYDTTGHKVKTVEATGSRMEVVLPAGFYVVECAGKVEKVMLRALSGRI